MYRERERYREIVSKWELVFGEDKIKDRPNERGKG